MRFFTNELTERYRFQDNFKVKNFNSGFPFKTKISQILINCGFSFFFFSTSRMNNESHNRTFYSYFKLQIRNQSSLFLSLDFWQIDVIVKVNWRSNRPSEFLCARRTIFFQDRKKRLNEWLISRKAKKLQRHETF